MTREWRDYLDDILDNARKAISFAAKDRDDERTFYAVVRALEIIGEAAGKIPLETREAYPDIPWQEMKGLRNILVHGYFGVDSGTIWETVDSDLPDLTEKLEALKKAVSKNI